MKKKTYCRCFNREINTFNEAPLFQTMKNATCDESANNNGGKSTKKCISVPINVSTNSFGH